MNEEYNLKLVMQAQNDASKVIEKVSSDVKQMKNEVSNASKSISWLTSKERAIKLRTNSAELKKELEDIRASILNLESADNTAENIEKLKQLRKEYSNVKEQLNNNAKALSDLWNNAKATTSLLTNLIWKLWWFAVATQLVNWLVNSFKEFQNSQRTLVEMTWATWTALRDLSNSMLEVQGTVQQSQWEIAEAIGELNTRLWITWKELQDTTQLYLNFADITWQQWKQAIADNIKMFNSWWVATNDQSKYLDMLAYAWQRTWVDVATLSRTLQDNSATLQQMWFSLTDSIALLSQFEQQGVDANSTLQAMKIWIANLINEWLAPTEARDTVISKIQNATTDAEAMNIAFEIFWQRWWLSMFKAIRSWTTDLKAMNQELENSIWTIERTEKASETLWEFLERKWSWAMASFIQWNNEWFRAVQDLSNMISDSLAPSIDNIESEFNKWKKWIEYLIKWNADLVVEWWNVSIVLNEQGVELEKTRIKTEQLKKAEENAIAITNQYAQSWELLNKALATFDALKIDDSTTRSEFEKSKSSALSLAQSFQVALASKLALARTNYKEATSSWDIHQVATAYKELNYLMQEQVWLQSKIAEIQNSTWSWKTIWWWSSWSWSRSTTDKEAENYAKAREKEFVALQKSHKEYVAQKKKEETAFYKQVDKEARESLKDQQKVLEDLEKEYKDKFDAIQDKIKDTQKEILSLNKELENISTQLANITKDENKSLAQEFLSAKDTVKELEREFEWIGDIANNISRDELNSMLDSDFVWWYAVENVKKMKTSLEEINWLYDWLSDEQRKQLDEEIAHQKWYNWLNRVEQIKEDYRVQREEAEKTYAEAEKKLNDQQEKLATLQEEQDKLREKYLWMIQDERDKYEDMYEDIKKFEQDYQTIFDNDIVKQKKAIGELEEMWRKVALAKESAWAYWSDVEARANGWDVYTNKPYLVGENWPELFVPSQRWSIVPNENITNNNWISINISWVSVRSDNDINAITDEIIRRIKLEKTFWIA